MKKSDLRDMLTADIKRIDDIRGRWMNVLYGIEKPPVEDHFDDLPKAERIAIDRVCFSLNILSNSFDNLVDIVDRLVDDEPKHRNR